MKHMKTLGYGKSAMERVIMDEATNMLERLSELSANPGNVVPIFMQSSYNILTDLVFGKGHFNKDPRLEQFLPKMHELIKRFSGNNIMTYFPYLRYLPVDLFGMKKADRGIDEMIELCADLIEQRKQTLTEEDGEDPYDLVGIFHLVRAKAAKEGTPSTEEITGE